MKNVIQITDKILGVIVDAEYTRFMIDEIDFYQGQFLLAAKEKGSYSVIKSFDDKHIIHGTCTLPLFDFDFEVNESWVKNTEEKLTWEKYYNYNTKMYSLDTKEESFRTRIQKAIQDEGMFFVNPYCKPLNIYYTPDYGWRKYPQEWYMEDLEQWQSAESKTVKKLLLIEKI